MYDNIDFITHGSPCQDFSVAGKQAGGDEGTNTRSSLMWNTIDIVKAVKPKIVLWENVKNLLSKKHKHNFDSYIEIMDELGYNSYYQVLNAKDYGIPQNRERVFTVSIRKDIDTGNFKFPEPIELKLRLKDMLEDEVDEKYYLSEKMTKNMTLDFSKIGKNEIDIIGHSGSGGQKGYIHTTNGIIGSLAATDYKQPKQIVTTADNVIEPKLNCIGNLSGGKWDTMYDCVKRVYDENGLCPTISTCQGGHTQPKIISDLRIRKLTPRECWRLMGFDDSDFNKVEGSLSNSQLYKMAGNSIVVNVLEEIYKQLFKAIKL